MIRTAMGAALLLAAPAAFAQTAPAQGPVTIEIVSAGQVTAPATRFRFTVTITGKGGTEKAAEAALAAHKAKMTQALAAMNIHVGKPVPGAPNSFASIMANVAGSRPAVNFGALAEESEDATPQEIASETIQFDAPSRAAVDTAEAVVEANGGAMGADAFPMLDDYVEPTRRAKADAIAKARAEAVAYGEALGLRRVTMLRISEKQDMLSGSMGWMTELMGMMAQKGAASSEVAVPVSLTIEFRLER